MHEYSIRIPRFRPARLVMLIACGAIVAAASAQPYDLSWHTVDAGGATFSTGGAFELGGTIGQHDAGPTSGEMTGGAFSLVGGFWPGAASSVCTCPGDMNLDGTKNGRDIQKFVECVLAPLGDCTCADINGAGGVTVADVPFFVADLLAGAACP